MITLGDELKTFLSLYLAIIENHSVLRMKSSLPLEMSNPPPSLPLLIQCCASLTADTISDGFKMM